MKKIDENEEETGPLIETKRQSEYGTVSSESDDHLEHVRKRKLTEPFLSIGHSTFEQDTVGVPDELLYPDKQQESDSKTPWISLIISYAVCFFITTQYSIVLTSLWPYLQNIDPSATEDVFGWIIAAYSAGNALASPVFGWWSNKIRKARIPIFTGCVLIFLSNCLYCFAEALPQSRKWWLMTARFVNGFGAGCICVLRAYSVTAAQPEDRSRSIALTTMAFSMGIIIGPSLQLIFVPLGYPGYIWGPIHIDMYTAPAFASLFITIIILILLMTAFKEHFVGIEEDQIPKEGIKYDKIAAIICIWSWFTSMTVVATLETIMSPFSMAVFSWNSKEAVNYNGLLILGFGAVSVLVYVLFAWKLSKIVDERKTAVAGYLILIGYHLLTFPWRSYSKLPDYRITALNPANYSSITNNHINFGKLTPSYSENIEPVGCQITFNWCTYTPSIPILLYILGFIIFISTGYPITNISVSTLYPKILGPIRQGIMQGILLFFGSLARTLGPILVTLFFTGFGSRMVWSAEAILLLVCIIPWLIFWKRMVPMEVDLNKYGNDE